MMRKTAGWLLFAVLLGAGFFAARKYQIFQVTGAQNYRVTTTLDAGRMEQHPGSKPDPESPAPKRTPAFLPGIAGDPPRANPRRVRGKVPPPPAVFQ